MHESKFFDDMAKIVPGAMSLITAMLMVVGVTTSLGKIEAFKFLIGEMAMVTAIAFSFQMGRGMWKISLPFVVLWFFAASLTFESLAWPVAK